MLLVLTLLPAPLTQASTQGDQANQTATDSAQTNGTQADQGHANASTGQSTASSDVNDSSSPQASAETGPAVDETATAEDDGGQGPRSNDGQAGTDEPPTASAPPGTTAHEPLSAEPWPSPDRSVAATTASASDPDPGGQGATLSPASILGATPSMLQLLALSTLALAAGVTFPVLSRRTTPTQDGASADNQDRSPGIDLVQDASLPAGAPRAMAVARALVARHDHATAVGWFETAIALDPKHPTPHYCLGLCLLALDRDEQALDAFKATRSLAPGHAGALYQQARALARLDRCREAIEALRLIVDVAPGMVETIAEERDFESLEGRPAYAALLRTS